MLTIHTAKKWDDFDIYCQGMDPIELYNSTIDLSEKLTELSYKINTEDEIEITTLLPFTLTRIGHLIGKKYIRHKDVQVIFYEEGKEKARYKYNNAGELMEFPLREYSPGMLPTKR